MKKLIVLLLASLLVVSACSWLPSTRPENKNMYVATLPLEECEQAIETPKPTIIEISQEVFFNWDESRIRDNQVEVLDTLASKLNEYPDTLVVIDGYASKEGPKDYNMVLSQARADSVKDALVKRGVDADRIQTVVGKGATTIFGDLLESNRKVIVLSIQ